MSAPKIMGMTTMFQLPRFPKGGAASALGRQAGSMLKWRKPNSVNRVRTLANGARVLPNRGDVILRGSC